MFDFIKNIFSTNSVDYKELMKNGAQIIDVRTPSEFSHGNIKNSRNVPLQQLAAEMKKMDLNKYL